MSVYAWIDGKLKPLPREASGRDCWQIRGREVVVDGETRIEIVTLRRVEYMNGHGQRFEIFMPPGVTADPDDIELGLYLCGRRVG